MTRKDYVRIAATLKATADSYGRNWDPNLFRAVGDVALNLATMLHVDNPAFDRARFLSACGMTETTGVWAFDPSARGQ